MVRAGYEPGLFLSPGVFRAIRTSLRFKFSAGQRMLSPEDQVKSMLCELRHRSLASSFDP